MAEKQRRRPLLAFCIATGVFFAIVTAAGLLGLPASWMALLIFGGLPFLFAFAAIIGLRATDSRMAKAGPGVLSALGPGEIREVPVPDEPMTRLGWRSAWQHLPALLPAPRRVGLALVAGLGAAAAGLLGMDLAEDLASGHLALSVALCALSGALAAPLVPLALWTAIAHRDSPLPRDVRRLLENSINPVNDRIRINLARTHEIDQAVEQRRAVYPLLLPIAMCASGALILSCVAQLVLTNGEDLPPFAGFAGMAMMLWVPLSTLGRNEQIALALARLRASDDVE